MDPDAWRPQAAALCAYFDGDRDATIVSRDDYGDVAETAASHFFRDEEALPGVERVALDLCRGHVLDVGAGAGCHALPLQRRGLRVSCIEILPELVALLRARGVSDATCAGLLSVQGTRFDSVLMLMNGLGLAGTLAGLGGLLRHLHRIVAPGGQVLADSTDVRRAYGECDEAGRQRSRGDGRYAGEFTMQLEFRGTRGPPYPYLYVDPDTLAVEAARAGWETDIVFAEDEAYLARLSRPVT